VDPRFGKVGKQTCKDFKIMQGNIATDKLWMFVPAQAVVGQLVESFREYPPSQKSGSFTVDQVLERSRLAPPAPASNGTTDLVAASMPGRVPLLGGGTGLGRPRRR
jgi:hypothetical protein